MGSKLEYGEKVAVHYSGFYLDGKKFDSSYDRGKPYRFQIGQAIMGWNEGLTHFRSGSKGKLFIPSRLAYGSAGYGSIPPDVPLVFDIHVLY